MLLLRYRMAAGLSQEDLAERAGLSRRGISDLERGARRARILPSGGEARGFSSFSPRFCWTHSAARAQQRCPT